MRDCVLAFVALVAAPPPSIAARKRPPSSIAKAPQSGAWGFGDKMGDRESIVRTFPEGPGSWGNGRETISA
jgi:hypothetical protein